MKTIAQFAIYIGIAAAILYLIWSVKRARALNALENPHDEKNLNDNDFEYDPDQLERIQNWNRENRSISSREIADLARNCGLKATIMNEQIAPATPPIPENLAKMFDEQFTKPRATDSGKLRLLAALRQTPVEDAIEMIEMLAEVIESEGEFDKPAEPGKTPRDGHSAAWHGYFILVNAKDYLKTGEINYEKGFYQPVFTREGENYMSTWELARRRWALHSSEDLNPGFAEVHQDFERRPIPCDHPFEWLCPGECGAQIHVSGRNMPEKIERNGLCEDCFICTKLEENKKQ